MWSRFAGPGRNEDDPALEAGVAPAGGNHPGGWPRGLDRDLVEAHRAPVTERAEDSRGCGIRIELALEQAAAVEGISHDQASCPPR